MHWAVTDMLYFKKGRPRRWARPRDAKIAEQVHAHIPIRSIPPIRRSQVDVPQISQTAWTLVAGLSSSRGLFEVSHLVQHLSHIDLMSVYELVNAQLGAKGCFLCYQSLTFHVQYSYPLYSIATQPSRSNHEEYMWRQGSAGARQSPHMCSITSMLSDITVSQKERGH